MKKIVTGQIYVSCTAHCNIIIQYKHNLLPTRLLTLMYANRTVP